MLELKGKIIIGDKNYAVEIGSDVATIKFDNQVFVRQDKNQDARKAKSYEYAEPKKIVKKKRVYHRTNWSKGEKKLLRKYYPNMTTKEIIEKNLIPGRTESAIFKEGWLLGLKKYKKKKQKPEPKKFIDWSFEEEEFLRNNFFKFGLETIIKDDLLPNKTEDQIRAKAKRMGVML